MRKPSLRKTMLVFAIATTTWLVPLLWSLRQKQPNAVSNLSAKVRESLGTRPLLLYVDAWPTRQKLDLREIQGLTDESESSLAPPHIAENLYAALGDLGITPEIHRIDKLPEAIELNAFKPIVMIYPVRHEAPPAEVYTFFDQRIEKFVAKHSSAKELALSDIAIGESSQDVVAAQKVLTSMNQYYDVSYQVGVQLTPQVSWRAEKELIRNLAAKIGRDATP